MKLIQTIVEGKGWQCGQQRLKLSHFLSLPPTPFHGNIFNCLLNHDHGDEDYEHLHLAASKPVITFEKSVCDPEYCETILIFTVANRPPKSTNDGVRHGDKAVQVRLTEEFSFCFQRAVVDTKLLLLLAPERSCVMKE